MSKVNSTDVDSSPVLPERVRRELQKGESIFHSKAACFISAKFPNGKWVGETRREVNGKLVKYPRKGFGTPQEALAYLKTLRPDVRGHVNAVRRTSATVADLFEYYRAHGWKRLSERRKQGKEARWRLHIAPYWGGWHLTQVTRKAAQIWITEVEGKIADGEAGKLGLPQFNEVRTDLSQMFELAADVDPSYGERRNPFSDLSFESAPPRAMVTLESSQFEPLLDVAFELVDLKLATPWVVEMFATSLLAGLREAEVIALMANRIDWNRRIITVDRALRLDAQDVDDASGIPMGPIKRLALGLPKKNKTRVVPISDQLEAILKPLWIATDRSVERPFLWPNEAGGMREPTRFHLSFSTLRSRFLAVSTFQHGRWKRLNDLIDEIEADKTRHLPKVFTRLDFRDTRNSFASYTNEVRITQATREAILGHAKGITNVTYTDMTRKTVEDARKQLSNGWTWNHPRSRFGDA